MFQSVERKQFAIAVSPKVFDAVGKRAREQEFYLREQVGHDLKQASNETGLPAFEGAPEA